jgi:LysM repeat protein
MKLFNRYQRILIMLVLLLVVATGCYRDAGKDIPEPTPHGNRSNQVVVNINPSPTRTPTDIPRPTKMVATFTPSPTGQPTDTPVVGGPNLGEEATAEVEEEEVEPTATFTSVADEEDTGEDEIINPPGPADTGISPTPTATNTSEPVPGLATPTALADQDECIYLVQGGDTLSSIAREYDLLPEDFYPVNPELAADPNNLYIGQEIRIPGCESETAEADTPPGQATDAPPADSAPPGTIIHVVQTGENLFRIATRYGVTVADLVAANDSLASENTLIYPGDRLIIPSQ